MVHSVVRVRATSPQRSDCSTLAAPPMTTDTAAPMPVRRRALGYSLYLVAALLFAFNGTISKAILLTGISGARLTQMRVTVSFLLLLVVVVAVDRRRLRIRRDEWWPLVAFGLGGVAMTQWLYFVAIARLPVGVALIIEFTAPIWVALWIRFGMRQPVRATVWAALGLAMVGLAMVAQLWQGFALDTVGVLAAIGAAVALALYFLLGERQSHEPFNRDAISLTMWGFGAAAVFWAVAQPWWQFPWEDLQGDGAPLGTDGPGVSLWLLTAWMIVLGTLAPFLLIVMALHHLTAAQASVVGLTEPLLASIVAWIALGEVLSWVQILGGAIVIFAVVLAERSR